ncbi:MAG: MMPL family transporter [Thermoleophilia bacterium]
MFARLGRLTSRFRWPLLALWAVSALLITLVAPDINSVAVNDQRAFLSAEAPSLDAIKKVEASFPGRISPSSTVVVVDAGPGGRADTGAARAFMEKLTGWLTGPDAPPVIDRVVSPVEADDQTAKALLSRDGRVGLIVVSFTKAGTEKATKQALEAIAAQTEAAPAGLRVYLTGDAAIIGAYDEATRRSIDSTTWITIVLVIVILLAVYRSPVSPLLPLATITLAYLISRGIVAFLGERIMTVSGYTNIFLIVVLFGAGTDYCLFLISRFREEMAAVYEPRTATAETVRTVGETIASSAGTVVVGLSTMALAELGLFNTTGPSVAIGVVVALAAGLTFTPALLSVLGDRTFWPRRARHLEGGRFWGAWARAVTSRPALALVGTLAVLVPLAGYGIGQTRDFDLLGDLPADTSAHQGFAVLAEHMGPGTMQPLTVLARDERGFDTALGLAHLGALQRKIAALSAVDQVRSFTASLANKGTLSVATQLDDQQKGVRAGMEQLRAALAEPGDLASAGPLLQQAASGLLDLFAYMQQLGREYPEVAQDAGYTQAMGALAALAEFGQPESGFTPERTAQLGAQLESLADGLKRLQETFAARPDALMLPATYLKSNEGLRNLKQAYLSADGQVARFQVVLRVGPYTPEAIQAVEALRRVVSTEGEHGVVEGSTAIVADLKAASERDMTRAVIFVLAGVFVVLVLLLRALVAPLYLILTILVSYGATLGIVRLVFADLLGVAGVTWWVPIFMFVMLVALGMDYNIFLMGRVKEEVAKAGTREGIRTAVTRTGGIITSAGVIMAGTFAAMMSASILGLVQIGFAVAVGVLLDTFVVRTALVPAIAVLLDRWSWWPRRQG